MGSEASKSKDYSKYTSKHIGDLLFKTSFFKSELIQNTENIAALRTVINDRIDSAAWSIRGAILTPNVNVSEDERIIIQYTDFNKVLDAIEREANELKISRTNTRFIRKGSVQGGYRKSKQSKQSKQSRRNQKRQTLRHK